MDLLLSGEFMDAEETKKAIESWLECHDSGMNEHYQKEIKILKDAGWDVSDALTVAHKYEEWSGESISLEDILKAVQGKATGGLFLERLVAWFAAAKVFMKGKE